ncbi:hypothetical protein PWT90_00882 [Aphanocladium album]|nr:hypothetical protein PWT90_00882 [Aphanocladium album]
MQPARPIAKPTRPILGKVSDTNDDDIYDIPTSPEATPISPAKGVSQAGAWRKLDTGKKRKHSSAFSGNPIMKRPQPPRPQTKTAPIPHTVPKRLHTPSQPLRVKEAERETQAKEPALLSAAPIQPTKISTIFKNVKSVLPDIPDATPTVPRRQRLIDTLAAQRAESPGSDRESDSASNSDAERSVSNARLANAMDESSYSSQSPQIRLGAARTPDRRSGPAKNRKIKLTYSSSRSFLGGSQNQNDNAMLDDGSNLLSASGGEDPFAAPLSPPAADYDFEEDLDGPKVGIQSVHELRRAGANNRFSDEMDDLLSRIGKPSAAPSSLRRNALCELASKLQRKEFAGQFRDHAARDNVVKAIGSEEDIISGLALTAALVTFLSFNPAPHLLRQLTTEKVGRLLIRLFREQRDVLEISAQKHMNLPRTTRASLEHLKLAVLQMDIWHGQNPISLTPRALALQLLVILSRSADIQCLERLTSDIERDVVSMAQAYSQERPPRNIDYILIILALELQSNLISFESEKYAGAIKGCLQATLDTWLLQNDSLDNSILKLAINITNSEIGASAFDDSSLLSKLVVSISAGLSQIQGTLQTGNFQNKLYDELLLILGILINILEHCPSARTSVDEGTLDKATVLWLSNMSFVNDADSVSKSKIGVALGYLAIVLGYLYLTASGRSQMRGHQAWPGTAHLVNSIEEFLRISKTIGNRTHELEKLAKSFESKMGQGRRMKRKQGAPEPLSEEHFARLKRKAGIPVDEDEQPAKTVASKRRRTAKKAAVAKKSKKPLIESDSEENSQDQVDLDDVFGDESDNKLGDDFIGSGDSVVDSDDEVVNKRERFVFSDDEDDSDKEEALTAANIEGLSKKLDMQLQKERAEADAEVQESALQTNLDGDRPKVLGSLEESDEELGNSNSLLAPDLQLLRQRITDIIRILGDFAKLAEEGRSRADYTSQLLDDICSYYNYSPFLAEKLYNLFTPREAFAFFEANEAPRPIVIRTNTLRTHRRDLAQALINRGVTLEPVGKWSKVGLQVFESSIPLGATPEYLAGHYILQAASSFLPVMALSPQPGERVLDMAAAPGGKTTHCAAMMKNTGVIVANDPNKARAKGLIGNIHRLGAKNVIVCSYDAREFPRVMGGFDRVLLDAPCSGTGVIAKDPSVKTNKTERDFMTLPHTQKQLLLSAIDSVNHAGTGGYIVYSTCSVTVEENEQVVAYALSRRPNVRLVDTELPFGKEGFTSYMGKTFDPSLKLTRRYYPHTYNVDGFYVAKFKKIGPTPANVSRGKGSADESMLPVDKTPIVEADPTKTNGDGAGGDFGGFDENEDKEYMERAKRSAMRRRGLDPRSLDRPRGEKKKSG